MVKRTMGYSVVMALSIGLNVIFSTLYSQALKSIPSNGVIRHVNDDYALFFTKNDSGLNCGNDTSLQITNELTIEFWINASQSTGHWYRLVGKFGQYSVVLHASTGVPFLELTMGKVTKNSYTTDFPALPPNELHYLAFTYDEVVIRQYFDGELKTATRCSGPMDTARNDFYIGYRVDAMLDEVRISNVSRSKEEIRDNYNHGDYRMLRVDKYTVGLWHFNEGSGTITYDETVNHNDAVFKGPGIPKWIKGISFPDPEIPTFYNIEHDNVFSDAISIFSCEWYSPVGLSGCIFSTNNTGSWVNDTWTDHWAGNPLIGWSNVKKVLNGAFGTVVGYKWYCNNTNDVWGETDIYSLTTMRIGWKVGFDAAKAYIYDNFTLMLDYLKYSCGVNIIEIRDLYWYNHTGVKEALKLAVDKGFNIVFTIDATENLNVLQYGEETTVEERLNTSFNWLLALDDTYLEKIVTICADVELFITFDHDNTSDEFEDYFHWSTDWIKNKIKGTVLEGTPIIRTECCLNFDNPSSSYHINATVNVSDIPTFDIYAHNSTIDLTMAFLEVYFTRGRNCYFEEFNEGDGWPHLTASYLEAACGFADRVMLFEMRNPDEPENWYCFYANGTAMPCLKNLASTIKRINRKGVIFPYVSSCTALYSENWVPSNKTLRIEISGTGTEELQTYWWSTMNSSVKIKLSNDTVLEAQDYYNNTTKLITIRFTFKNQMVVSFYEEES